MILPVDKDRAQKNTHAGQSEQEVPLGGWGIWINSAVSGIITMLQIVSKQ